MHSQLPRFLAYQYTPPVVAVPYCAGLCGRSTAECYQYVRLHLRTSLTIATTLAAGHDIVSGASAERVENQLERSGAVSGRGRKRWSGARSGFFGQQSRQEKQFLARFFDASHKSMINIPSMLAD